MAIAYSEWERLNSDGTVEPASLMTAMLVIVKHLCHKIRRNRVIYVLNFIWGLAPYQHEA